jgi:hypothetical protein
MNSNHKLARRAPKKSPGGIIGNAVRAVRAALNSEEDAIALLKSQHEDVKSLFKAIEKASTRAKKNKLFDELAASLVAHDAIEREIFYPACEKGMGMTDLLGEALVEHGVVEFSLYQADQSRHEKDFSFKCHVLSEIVEHHVEDEEKRLLPEGRKGTGQAAARGSQREDEGAFRASQGCRFSCSAREQLETSLGGRSEAEQAYADCHSKACIARAPQQAQKSGLVHAASFRVPASCAVLLFQPAQLSGRPRYHGRYLGE